MMNLPPGLALDIDDTLCITAIRILQALQKNFGNPEGLTPQELKKKYNHTSEIPYWNSAQEHLWKLELLESDELYENADVIENASHFVNMVNSLIPISCYITARPEGTTEASKRWLKKNNFPDREVISKPNSVAYDKGNHWKAELLTAHHPHIIGIVDDNPGIIKALPAEYQGIVFLFDHHEYTEQTPIKVIPCKTWNHVYTTVQGITFPRPQSQP